MTIAIVTDSAASLTAAEAERLGITVVGLQVILGSEVLTEGVDVTPTMIAEALGASVPVSTSRPTPERFVQVYQSLAASGIREIVSIHLSSKMSGTLESAALAASRISVPVTVVDTHQVGMAAGQAVMRAAEIRGSGGDSAAIVNAAEASSAASRVFIYVDTLEYLRRGGRLGAAAALIGSALAVKPILKIEQGSIVPHERVRTTSRALARLQTSVIEAADEFEDGFLVGVQHLANAGAAHDVANGLAGSLAIQVPVAEVGAAIGAHVGPGMVAVTLTPA